MNIEVTTDIILLIDGREITKDTNSSKKLQIHHPGFCNLYSAHGTYILNIVSVQLFCFSCI